MLDDDGQWPIWTAPPGTEPQRDGYGGISRYVVPQVLEERFRHAFPLGLRQLCGQKQPEGPALDRLVAQRVWENLVARQLTYTAPPWHPAEGQRIRDPEWLLRSGGSGTCLDLALLLAGACLNEDLDTSLVMLRGRHQAHAAVLVRLGSRPGIGDEPLGVATTSSEGVGLVVDRAQFVGEPDVLLLDPTTATAASEETSLEHTAAGLESLVTGEGYDQVHVVDVAVRQRLGDQPLPAPTRRGALRSRLAAPTPSRSLPFPSRDRARAEARAAVERQRGGVLVIHGPEGTGKSTLARQFALEVDAGFGWFLSGASPAAYRASLARAELGERGQELSALDAELEKEFARSALERLADENGNWVVVLDNANDGPASLGALPLPVPRDSQLLLVTTTGDPARWPGATPVGLSALGSDDLLRADVDDRLRRVSAGSPLLLSAFTALGDAAPHALDGVDGVQVDDVDTGAELYWSSVRSVLPREAEVAERLAFLPPDVIERAVVDELHPGALAALERSGLLTPLTDRIFSLHRVLGRAIRTASSSVGAAATAAGDVLGADLAFRSLVRFADRQVTAALAEALHGCDDGVAVARLGTLQELHDGAQVSLATYLRAEPLLQALDPAPGTAAAEALADCRHAQAREVNQRGAGKATAEEVAGAQQWIAAAVALRGAARTVEVEKHLALGALLRKRGADLLPEGSPEQVAEFLGAADDLKGSWQRRHDILGADHPLVDRAWFNLAGVRIRLARLQEERAAEHLAIAERVYRDTLAFRRAFYPDLSPLTAASYCGIATWAYYAVLTRVADDGRATLEEGVREATESLRIRLALGVRSDVAKSASILAKLGLVQVNKSGGDASDLAHEALEELELDCPEPAAAEKPTAVLSGQGVAAIPLQDRGEPAPPRAAAGS